MADYCAATRQAFDGLFTKPVLTDKLLQRPPFKFIGDVITSAIKAGSFGNKLFVGELADVALIKEKDTKIAFLARLINAIELALGRKLDGVSPAKIIAGLEPAATNTLLQSLAECVRTVSKEQNVDIVRKINAGEKFDEPGSAGSNKENRKATKERSKSRDKTTDKPAEKETIKEGHAKTEKKAHDKSEKSGKEGGTTKKSTDTDDVTKKTTKAGDKQSVSPTTKLKSSEKSSDKDETKPVKRTKSKSDADAKTKSGHLKVNHNQKDSGHASRESSSHSLNQSPSSARKTIDAEDKRTIVANDEIPAEQSMKHGKRPSKGEDIDLDTPIKPRSPPQIVQNRPDSSFGQRPTTSMGRPGTSMGRPAPPRIRRKELGEATAANAAATVDLNTTTSHIIETATEALASGARTKDDTDEFVVDETQEMGAEMRAFGEQPQSAIDVDNLDAAEHGGLVRKMLATKKELETGLADDDAAGGGRTQLVWDERERERVRAETGKIQSSVQSLTRAAHPLARLFDYMQEDIDSMSRELDTWRTEHRNNKRQLRMLADTNTDANTQALKVCVCTYTARTHADDAQARLADLDARIKDAEDACAAVRTKIYANDTHIRQLIANVTNR